MTKIAPRAEIRLLLDLIDQAFDTRAWHGTTLRGSLRGLTPPRTRWRPGPKRHNIWELVLHTAYWKYIVTRRITGDRSLRFPRSPSNWPASPEPGTVAQLRADIRLLTEQHAVLRDAVARFPVARLRRQPPAGKWSYGDLIQGVAAHDLYHAGQVQLLKRLQTEA